VGQAFGEAIPLELACQIQIKNVSSSQTGMSDPPAKSLFQQLANCVLEGLVSKYKYPVLFTQGIHKINQASTGFYPADLSAFTMVDLSV
jgi:hypothetical protein